MKNINELIFRVNNKLRNDLNVEKDDIKELLSIAMKMEKQFAISGVVSTYVRYLGVPTWGLRTNSHYELLDYNDSKYKIKDDEGNVDWCCKKSFEKL